MKWYAYDSKGNKVFAYDAEDGVEYKIEYINSKGEKCYAPVVKHKGKNLIYFQFKPGAKPEGFEPEGELHFLVKYFVYTCFRFFCVNQNKYHYELNLLDAETRNVEKTMQFDGKYYRFDTYFENVEVKYYKDKNCVKPKTRNVAIEIMDTHKTPDEKIKAAEANNIDIYEFDVKEFKKIYKKVMKEKFETPKLLSKESFIKYTKKLAVNLKNEEFSIDEITSNYFKKVNN